MRILRRFLPGLLFLLVFVLTWQLFVNWHQSVLIPSPFGTLASAVNLFFEGSTWNYFWLSNQALIIGFSISVVVGVLLGLVVGRFDWAERVINPWLSILLVLPMSMLMPVIVVAIGFTLSARVLIVFLFTVPTVIVNTRAGLREVPSELIEMGQVFGAKEIDLWRKILLSAAAPAMWTGFRLGLGRAITGMVLGELLLVAVGIGAMFQQFSGDFAPDKTFALVVLLVIESITLMRIMRAIEVRTIPWFYIQASR